MEARMPQYFPQKRRLLLSPERPALKTVSRVDVTAVLSQSSDGITVRLSSAANQKLTPSLCVCVCVLTRWHNVAYVITANVETCSPACADRPTD